MPDLRPRFASQIVPEVAQDVFALPAAKLGVMVIPIAAPPVLTVAVLVAVITPAAETVGVPVMNSVAAQLGIPFEPNVTQLVNAPSLWTHSEIAVFKLFSSWMDPAALVRDV